MCSGRTTSTTATDSSSVPYIGGRAVVHGVEGQGPLMRPGPGFAVAVAARSAELSAETPTRPVVPCSKPAPAPDAGTSVSAGPVPGSVPMTGWSPGFRNSAQ
ncbi:hypothetical protein ACRAWF_02950 [Streptomyces sp. L7]